MRLYSIGVTALSGLLFALAGQAHAQLVPGDIVTTSYFGQLPAGVSRLVPGGTLEPISINGQFANLQTPTDLDITPDGQVIVSVSQSRLVRVDPTSGAQVAVRTLTSGSQFIAGVTVGSDGNYYVLQRAFTSSSQPTQGNIFRVTPDGASQQFISGRAPGFGPTFLQFPNHAALTADGDLLVADLGDVVREDDFRSGRVVRIELQGTAGGSPNLGGQTLISPAALPAPGTSTFSPNGIAISPDGQVFISDTRPAGTAGGIYRIDVPTGTLTLITAGSDFRNLAFDPFTSTLLAVRDQAQTVVRINPVTGQQTTLLNFAGSGGTVYGLAVFAPPGYTLPCPADLTNDRVVDGSDFVAFINSFSIANPATDPLADINRDSIIDGDDFVLFINAFASGC